MKLNLNSLHEFSLAANENAWPPWGLQHLGPKLLKDRDVATQSAELLELVRHLLEAAADLASFLQQRPGTGILRPTPYAPCLEVFIHLPAPSPQTHGLQFLKPGPAFDKLRLLDA